MSVVQISSLNLAVHRSAVTPTHFEVSNCRVTSHHTTVLIYKSPPSNISDFLDEFEDLVTSLAIISGRQLILGHINVHVSRITNFMVSAGLVQHMTVPATRYLSKRIHHPHIHCCYPTKHFIRSSHNNISINVYAPRLPSNKWRGRDNRHVNLDLFKADLHAALISNDENISDNLTIQIFCVRQTRYPCPSCVINI